MRAMTNDDDLSPLPTIRTGRYRHYKGGEYQVLGVVRHSESLEPMVLYRPLGRDVGDWVCRSRCSSRPWSTRGSACCASARWATTRHERIRGRAMILSPHELHFTAIRAQGPGGQNVNKVSCAVHLRFDIRASSLPEAVKERLLQSPDQRVSRDGVIVIKAQASRSLEQNKLEAVARLQALVAEAARVLPPRKATKPTRGSQRRRLEAKSQRGEVKAGRGKVGW